MKSKVGPPDCKLKCCILGKANFKKKMKNHYKGEFNMAALLKSKPPPDSDEEDEK